MAVLGVCFLERGRAGAAEVGSAQEKGNGCLAPAQRPTLPGTLALLTALDDEGMTQHTAFHRPLWEKIFANNTAHEDLISKVSKKLIELNIKKQATQ